MMLFDEFFAEAKRLNLTAADLVPHLVMRPEFDDCLSDNFREAKATIMALPERDVRALAIAQFIQLQTHEKYGNTMQNLNAAYRAEQAGASGVALDRTPEPSPRHVCGEQGYNGMIDRYLRNNLDDSDYAEYSAALEAVYGVKGPGHG